MHSRAQYTLLLYHNDTLPILMLLLLSSSKSNFYMHVSYQHRTHRALTSPSFTVIISCTANILYRMYTFQIDIIMCPTSIWLLQVCLNHQHYNIHILHNHISASYTCFLFWSHHSFYWKSSLIEFHYTIYDLSQLYVTLSVVKDSVYITFANVCLHTIYNASCMYFIYSPHCVRVCYHSYVSITSNKDSIIILHKVYISN